MSKEVHETFTAFAVTVFHVKHIFKWKDVIFANQRNFHAKMKLYFKNAEEYFPSIFQNLWYQVLF